MILWVFIKNFGVKIVITDIYRYLPIFYRYLPIFCRYLPIFYRYFFENSCTSVRVPQSQFFGGKIGFFRFFGEKSAILPIFSRFFLLFFFSVPAENRFFDEISAEKTNFLFPDNDLGVDIFGASDICSGYSSNSSLMLRNGDDEV